MGCTSSSPTRATKMFVTHMQNHKYIDAQHDIEYDSGLDPDEIVHVNAIIDEASLLCHFFANLDDIHANCHFPILTGILFPATKTKTPQPRCDIFNQQLSPDMHKALLNADFPVSTAYNAFSMLLIFTAVTSKVPPAKPVELEDMSEEEKKSQSLWGAPKGIVDYLSLMLEAADILPSPKNRCDPSIWKRHAEKDGGVDKEAFVFNQVFLPALKFRPTDTGIFSLIFDNDLITKPTLLAEVLSRLAAETGRGTAPILRAILASGKFPKNLYSGEDAAAQVANLPLRIAAVRGNVEVIKELSANNVGGGVGDVGPTQERNKNVVDLSDLRSYAELSSRVSLNAIHLAAGAPAIDPGSSSQIKAYADILTILLSMPGSNDAKNAVFPFRADTGKIEIEMNPMMLAAIQGNERQVEILKANGADELCASAKDEYGSLDDFVTKFNKMFRN